MRLTGCKGLAPAALLLGVLSGCGQPGTAASDGREVLVSFVDHLQAGAVGAAYGELCGATRDRFDAAAFAAFVGRQRKFKSYAVGQHVNAPGTALVGPSFADRAVHHVQLDLADGTAEYHEIPVVRDTDDTFRVCGDPY